MKLLLNSEWRNQTDDIGSLQHGDKVTHFLALALKDGTHDPDYTNVIGHIAMYLDHASKMYYMTHVVTEKSHRGKGIAKALLAACIAESDRLGSAMVTGECNPDLMAFYKNFGVELIPRSDRKPRRSGTKDCVRRRAEVVNDKEKEQPISHYDILMPIMEELKKAAQKQLQGVFVPDKVSETGVSSLFYSILQSIQI